MSFITVVSGVVLGSLIYDALKHKVSDLRKISKPKVFRVRFVKEIIFYERQDYRESASLIKFVDLPFAPHVGMSIKDYNDKIYGKPLLENINVPITEDFISGEIVNVEYDGEGFDCMVEPHEMTKDNKLGAVLNFYMQYGWDGRFLQEEDNPAFSLAVSAYFIRFSM